MRSDPSGAGRPTEIEDLDAVVEEVRQFVRDATAAAGREGIVVEISDGLNSAITTMLAVDALGADRVYGLLLPTYMSTEAAAVTSELVAEGVEIEYAKVQLLPFVHLFHELSVPPSDGPREIRSTTRAIDCMRMACASYAAEALDRVVLGTANRTEWLLGTVAPAGVNRGELLPLGDLYGTDVVQLASHIGIPKGLYDSIKWWPDGWLGEEDVDALTVDRILRRLVDDDVSIERTAAELGADVDLVRTIAERHVRSRHLRAGRPTPATAQAAGSETFHELELRFD